MASNANLLGAPAGESASAAMSALLCSHLFVSTGHVLMSFDAAAMTVLVNSYPYGNCKVREM